MRRPSQNLPEGCPKKVSPLGEWSDANAADIAPVSEFESPKLYIAGNLHRRRPPPPNATGCSPTNPRTMRPNTQDSLAESMVMVVLATNILSSQLVFISISQRVMVVSDHRHELAHLTDVWPFAFCIPSCRTRDSMWDRDKTSLRQTTCYS